MKRLFVIAFLVTVGVASRAQVRKTTNSTVPAANHPASEAPRRLHLRVLARSYGDSIVLRWAPANAVAWLMGNDSGYRIARIDYSDRQHPVTTVLAPRLRPLTLDQMMATLRRDDRYAAIAAQALYGKDFRMTREAPYGLAKKVKQAHDALNFRYSFTLEAADFSPEVAGAIALRWVDKDVRKGSSYIYVITVCGATKEYVVDSAATLLADNAASPVPAPDGLEGFGFDRKSELHWNRRQMGNFSAYDIQRSEDGGQHWVTINKMPYLSPDQLPPASGKTTGRSDTIIHKIGALLRDHQVFTDSLPLDYHPYLYRVRGIDAFAEWSPWSAAIRVEGRDLTPPFAPVIDSVRNVGGSQLRIVWSQRVTSPDLAGYYISKSNSAKGPFYPLTRNMLPRDTRSFTDPAGVPHLPNYYVIVAVDTARNVASSGAFPGYLTDTTAPAAPVGVTGSIDSAGVVKLHWSPNPEPDLKGYKVYFAYGAGDQYEEVGGDLVTDTSFVDSISTSSLNRRIWYSVVAVDNSNNHSAYSRAAMLRKTKVSPPSAPVAATVSVAGNRVTIEWLESRSEGVAAYEIARVKGGENYFPVAKLSQNWNRRSVLFTDTISNNTDYYYVACTVDSLGLRSEWSAPVHAVFHRQDSLAPVSLQVRLTEKGSRHVRLSWQYKETGDYFFVVYRASPGGPLSAWQSFDKGVLSGEDDEAGSGDYVYAIRVVHRDRLASSKLSKSIHVMIP